MPKLPEETAYRLIKIIMRIHISTKYIFLDILPLLPISPYKSAISSLNFE